MEADSQQQQQQQHARFAATPGTAMASSSSSLSPTSTSSAAILASTTSTLGGASSRSDSQAGSDEETGDEVIQYVRKEKLEKFFKHFPDMPDTEDLLLAKSCSLEKEVPIPGDLYVTRNLFCFYGKLFGKKHKIIIPVKQVSAIEKKKKGLFQNSIRVETKDGSRVLFSGFSKRDIVHDRMTVVLKTTTDPLFLQVLQSQTGDHDNEPPHDSSPRVSLEVPSEVPTIIHPGFVIVEDDSKSTGGKSDIEDRHDFEQEARPEKIFRKKVTLEILPPSPSGSFRSGPPSPLALFPDSVPMVRSPSSGSQSPLPADRQSVIANAKEKKKRKESEQSVVQRVLLNELFSMPAQDVFNFLYRPTPIPCSRKSDVALGTWEIRDGQETRDVTFSSRTLIHSKEKEKHTVCKFKETQRVTSKKPDSYILGSEITPVESDLFEGTTSMTVVSVSPFVEEGNKAERCRLNISVQIFHSKSTPPEILDALLVALEADGKDLSEFLNKEVQARSTPPPLPDPAPSTALIPPTAAAPSKAKLPQDANLVLLGSAIGIALALVLVLVWWLSSSTDPLASEEKKWLDFLKSTRTPSYDPTATSRLYDTYRGQLRNSDIFEKLGAKTHEVAEKLVKFRKQKFE